MTSPQVTILGIGNVLWADEGFGVRTVETLNRRYRFNDHVVMMDGGTQGIYLVQHVQAADILLVFDAIDYGLPPGTLKLIEGDDVPNFMGAKKMSLHQTGFQEVLAMAELLGDYPSHLLLVGVQPEELEDYGGSLRPSVKAQIEPAIEAALQWLSDLGVEFEKRDQPLSDAEKLSPDQLSMDAYETGRPDEQAALRLGDPRVLLNDQVRFEPKQLIEPSQRMSVNVDARRKD
jgi:hydrogenase maturation protease